MRTSNKPIQGTKFAAAVVQFLEVCSPRRQCLRCCSVARGVRQCLERSGLRGADVLHREIKWQWESVAQHVETQPHSRPSFLIELNGQRAQLRHISHCRCCSSVVLLHAYGRSKPGGGNVPSAGVPLHLGLVPNFGFDRSSNPKADIFLYIYIYIYIYKYIHIYIYIYIGHLTAKSNTLAEKFTTV